MEAKRYLLDTNILSDLIRNPGGRITERIGSVGEAAVCTSVIVAAELHYGALKRGSAALSKQVNSILEAMEILPFEPPCEYEYARLRVTLEREGTPIGGNDMLIAAQALAENLVLVTHNTREFHRVPGLTVEDWLT